MKKNNDSSSKKYYIWAVVLVILLIILAVSITYAYFARLKVVTGDTPETTVTSGLLDVDFTTSKYISNTNAKLINDDVAYTQADKTIFSVIRSSKNTTNNVYYTISLTDINISDNLKNSPYFKWALYNTNNVKATSVPISKGNFKNVSDGNLSLYTKKLPLAKDAKHNYTLIVWLSNDPDVDQESLLNGSFEAKVQLTVTNN